DSADVLSTNWRQKALVKLGLDYETLKKKYPGLIYAQISGYGDGGPEKDSPGYDTICFAARGGWFRTLPQEGDAPMNWPNAMGDLAASMALAGGICGALVKKQKTGLGDRVNVSLYHTALYLLSMAIVSSAYDNHYPSSRKNPPSPLNNTYETKDGGWIYLCMPVYDVEYNRCMALIGRDDLIDSPVYKDYGKVRAEGRVTEVVEIIEEGFRKKDMAEWMRIFRENDIPAGKCFEVDDILADPQAWENSFLRKIDYGNGREGVVTDTPVRFNSIGLSPLRASKPIGYHTEEVLGQYGYPREKLEELKARGVVVVKEHNYD
ncbi:MAG: CoA transferase, partial [Clostridia bacterium]|nr:CoA transferase [Clostridia bacterium]